jgi:hypothetical protein
VDPAIITEKSGSTKFRLEDLQKTLKGGEKCRGEIQKSLATTNVTLTKRLKEWKKGGKIEVRGRPFRDVVYELMQKSNLHPRRVVTRLYGGFHFLASKIRLVWLSK